MTIRVFDVFCGAGGCSRGALMAGATPVAGLDKWDLAIESYSLNFPEAKTYRMEAHRLSARTVLDDVGEIDLIVASPECTSHSVAKGRSPGCENSRATAFEVIRFARVLKPRWIIVENVIQMRQWKRFDEWHQKLRRLGYQTTFGVLDAQDFGTPQSRRRLFILCDRERLPALPRATSREKKTVASILGCGESRTSPWQFSPLDTPQRAPATITRAERAIAAVGKNVPFIMVYYGSDGAGGFQRLDRPLRTVTTLDRFAYVRLNGDGHEMRMLQPPELAAAMGFPRSHIWAGTSRRDKIHQIGNAVCPPLIKAIIRELRDEENE